MTTQLRPGTIAALTAGTAAAGLLAYAMYFDHRRRSDPEFRKALKRESKRTARAAKQEAEADRTAKLREVRQVVDEMTDLPTSQEEVEAYFMEQVAQGERISQDDPYGAAQCFYRAMKVYPQPKDLSNIYDRTVPKPILDILAEIIAADPQLTARTTGSASGSDSGSIVNVE